MAQPRRTSLGMLLRRSKSGELRKPKATTDRVPVPMVPPKLPEFAKPADHLASSFGPELRTETESNGTLDKAGLVGSTTSPVLATSPPPPIMQWDGTSRSGSMTNRARYSYSSSIGSTLNNPRRVRRRKDPTPFNVMIIGSRNAGKTSFLEFLKTSFSRTANSSKKSHFTEDQNSNIQSGQFASHYLETEIDGERVGLTLWDSEGLERNIVDLQLREMTAFLESKFEETFTEEMKVMRSPGFQDTHIHAVFLVLDPNRLDQNIALSKGSNRLDHRVIGALDEDLDIQVLRALKGKTTVIPIISKADTVTSCHMDGLKKVIVNSFKESNIDVLDTINLNDDSDEASSIDSGRIDEEDEIESSLSSDPQTPDEANSALSSTLAKKEAHDENQNESADASVQSSSYILPLSIISPDLYEPEVLGRKFPWGFADPYNEAHCDFLKLKDLVFSDWRAELREASREQWYEGWRTNRLKQSSYH